MSFTYTQSGPSPVGTLNLNSAHLKLTFQNKKLIFFNDVSLGGDGSNIIASNTVQAPGFQFADTTANGLIYATNGVFNTTGSNFSISGNTLTVPNLTVSGNLTVNGTFTTINTTTLVITDPIVQIGSNITDTSNVGLILTGGPSYSNVAFGFQPGMNAVVLTGTTDSAYGPTMTPTSNINFIVYGNVSAAGFVGDGSGLTNIVTSSNLYNVTQNGNVTSDYVTLGGLTTIDGCLNGLEIQAPNGNVLSASFAIGHHTAPYAPGDTSMAVGNEAGASNQGIGSTAVGYYAGHSSQGNNSVAFGYHTADISQGSNAVAIGNYTGSSSQSDFAVAIGTYAGQLLQQTAAVAIGSSAGNDTQGFRAVAIGFNAGQTSQGSNTVAIGAYAGQTNQTDNSIIINATGIALNTSNAGFYVNPIRYAAGGTSNILGYNIITHEIYDAGADGNGSSNLESITLNGAITDQTITFSNVTLGINVASDVMIGGNLISNTITATYSMAANVINANEAHITSLMVTGTGLATFNGNVSAPYFIGDGSLLSNISGVTTSNLQSILLNGNVTNQSITFTATGNTITSAGSITAAHFYGDGSSLSNISTVTTSNLQSILLNGNVTNQSITFTATGNTITSAGSITAAHFYGDGSGLSNISGVTTSNLETVTLNGAVTNQTVTFSNVTTGIHVTSNVLVDMGLVANTITATYSMASNVINANEAHITSLMVTGTGLATFNGNVSAPYFIGDGSLLSNISGVTTSNLETVTLNGAITDQAISFTNTAGTALTINGLASIGTLDANVITSNALVVDSVLTENLFASGDVTVDGSMTVQILKFTTYSGLDPDTGNTAVIASATGGSISVSALGVAYGSNVVNLSGYVSPITAFSLSIDDNAQLYLFAPGVSVNTTSTSTVKFTNPAVITTSNVLFHVTKIMNAGFSVVNAIIVD